MSFSVREGNDRESHEEEVKWKEGNKSANN
jgi:hypothetical protein